MESPDKKYLSLQFRLRVHEKDATEFQRFFESIMIEAFPDFQKIRPYGRQGDAGNDGYRPDEGIYYQAYAPEKPDEKEAAAAQKLKRDFDKLKASWDKISPIKVFYFVFNDKWRGVSIEIERTLSELRASHPTITFKTFLPKDLEDILLSLKSESILSLGFDVDSTNALRICRDNLTNLEIYLDRGNAPFVLESLQNSKDIIVGQNDDALLADWEILYCRALQQMERTKEAVQKYESLCKRYPSDPRPLLYLAEIYLNAEDFGKNAELLAEAERIDNTHWLLRVQKLIRDLRLDQPIDTANIDERTFPSDPRAKSTSYRLYATILVRHKEFARADAFVEKAIYLTPERLSNYISKLAIVEQKFLSLSGDEAAARNAAKDFLLAADSILDEISPWVQVNARHQVIFNTSKFRALIIQENYSELERLAKDSFDLFLKCHFDFSVDRLLAELLIFVEMPQSEFEKLLEFLRGVTKPISDHLAKALLSQFLLRKALLTDGKRFFEMVKKENILDFISKVEQKDYDAVWHFLKDDLRCAVNIANSAKDLPDLRREIIERLPDGADIQKDKLSLLLNYDESKLDEAFDILKTFDLSKATYLECEVFLDIVRKKKAWDFVILVVETLLPREQNKQIALKLELELFDATLKVERLPEAIEIGERILSDGDKLARLDDQNKESLLAQTLLARLERGEYPAALKLLEAHPNIPKTFEFKLGVEAEIYLKNREVHKAIESIIEGVKILRTPTPEQYAKLFMLSTQISNMTGYSLDSLQIFEPDSFVKFKGQERWYFVGDGDELDAHKISSTDERYAGFAGKKVGDKVVFEFKYQPSSEHIIENMLPIEKYIFLQSAHHFYRLAAGGNLEGVLMVAVPKEGDKIDTTNIEALMGDLREGGSEFFDRYCEENIPLAFLAVVEGGLTNAIGLIQNEGRGFVRFSSGDPAEMEKQKEVAKRILSGDAFYIDGTSAIFLAETGLLKEIHSHVPNLKTPQSVIAMLLKCQERFRYLPGQAGHMHYAQGKLRMSPISPDKGALVQNNFGDAVKLLESNRESISVISAASKKDCFTEQKVPAEICDACVLAQNFKTAVLTEDYLYLQANEIDTGKKSPEYCSAFALIRVLYEQKKISLEKYLGFFTYLSNYRFRFLPVTVDDIEKAVLGDGIIATVQPEKIRWFNFALTLSEAYGVPFDVSVRVMATFLIRILRDDAIVTDVVDAIFLEILTTFPVEKNKRALGKLLVAVCAREIAKLHGTISGGSSLKNKIDRLSRLSDIFKADDGLWTPGIK